jgi:hypothetical protein
MKFQPLSIIREFYIKAGSAGLMPFVIRTYDESFCEHPPGGAGFETPYIKAANAAKKKETIGFLLFYFNCFLETTNFSIFITNIYSYF